MAAPTGEIPEESLQCHTCMCTWHPYTPTTQSTHPDPKGEPPNQDKNSISLQLIKIILFCWRFEICREFPPFGEWMSGYCQITKNLINLYLIEIIQFCLKIYDLWKHPTYGCVVEWDNGCSHDNAPKSNKSWPNWDNSILFEYLICGDTLTYGCFCG